MFATATTAPVSTLPMPPAAAPAVPSVSALFADFVAYVDGSPRTIQTYSNAIRQFGRWLEANHIAQPSGADVRRYRDELAATHKPTTVRGYVCAVRLFFQWATEKGLYQKNPAARLRAPRVGNAPRKDALTASQARAVLAAARRRSRRDFAMFSVLLTAGLRAVEMVRLDVADFATQCGVPGLYVQGKGHSEKDAFQTLPAATVEAVRDYLEERGPVDPTAPLFASESNNSRGGRLTTVSLSRLAKELFRSCGIDSPRISLHATRHFAATAALLAGRTIQEVAQFMRHANISTTQIYAHNLERLSNSCGSSIADILF